MSTIVNIEYIGPRRDPDYAKKIGCVEGTRELSRIYHKPVFKRATGKDRDLADDVKTLVPVEIRIPVPYGKSITINNILYNFIPETDYRCEVADPLAIGRLLAHSNIFRKVQEKQESPKIVAVPRKPKPKKTVKKSIKARGRGVPFPPKQIEAVAE